MNLPYSFVHVTLEFKNYFDFQAFAFFYFTFVSRVICKMCREGRADCLNDIGTLRKAKFGIFGFELKKKRIMYQISV